MRTVLPAPLHRQTPDVVCTPIEDESRPRIRQKGPPNVLRRTLVVTAARTPSGPAWVVSSLALAGITRTTTSACEWRGHALPREEVLGWLDLSGRGP